VFRALSNICAPAPMFQNIDLMNLAGFCPQLPVELAQGRSRCQGCSLSKDEAARPSTACPTRPEATHQGERPAPNSSRDEKDPSGGIDGVIASECEAIPCSPKVIASSLPLLAMTLGRRIPLLLWAACG